MSLQHEPMCCGQPMSRIWHAAERTMRGFFCARCKKFDRAIGREKQLSPTTEATPNATQS